MANFRPQNLHGQRPLSNDAKDEETLSLGFKLSEPKSADPESLISVTELSVITAGSEVRRRPSTDDSNEVRAEAPPNVGEARPAKFVDNATVDTKGSGGDGAPFKNEAEIYDGSISKDDRSWIGELIETLLVRDSRGPGIGGGGGDDDNDVIITGTVGGGPGGGNINPLLLLTEADDVDPIDEI